MSTRQVWGGRYVVFEELASGGMATVYLAGRLGAAEGPRIVAIKKMFEQFAREPAFVTMFLDEAHLAEQIRHPNVVQTREFLRVPGTLGIVMDFVLGIAMVDLVEKSHELSRPVPVEVATAIAEGVLRGLHAAHELRGDDGKPLGVVHRDMSPHNILVGKDGVARIIDFGIAKAAGRLHVTDAGVMKGKFAYMAPEQVVGSEVDRRSDIFSTAVVLWEALTGRYLFDAPTDAALIAKRAAGTTLAPRPSTFNRAVPRALDAVVVRALEADPEDRYKNAAEMADALAGAQKPATSQVVAAWVQAMAGLRLIELAAMYERAEASFAAGETGRISAPSSLPVASLPDGVDVPDLELPTSNKPSPPSSQASPAKPASAKKLPPLGSLSLETPAEIFAGSGLDLDIEAGPSSLASQPAAPRVSSASLEGMSSPMQSRMSSASLDVRRVAADARESSRAHRSSGTRWRGTLAAALLLAVLAGAVLKLGPPLLLSYTVEAAARRGLTLRAERLELRAGGMTLYDVHAALTNAADVALRAPEVDIDLDLQGSVTGVSIPGYELLLRGSLADVGARIAAWQKQPFVPLTVEARSGRLSWQGALSSTSVDAVDVRLSLGGQDEPKLHVETPTLTMHLPIGELGPWRARLDTTANETTAFIGLSRTIDGPPSVTFVARPVIGQTLSIAIPHAKLSDLGIPPEVLHVSDATTIEVALDGQALPGGQTLQAHGRLGFRGAPSGELAVEGEISGDVSETLSVQHCKLAVGKVVTPVTGRATFTPEAIRFEIDQPPAKGQPPSLLVLDTHDWTGPSSSSEAKAASPSGTPAPAESGTHR